METMTRRQASFFERDQTRVVPTGEGDFMAVIGANDAGQIALLWFVWSERASRWCPIREGEVPQVALDAVSRSV